MDCSGVQCVAACCSVIQCVVVCCSMLHCVAVCCSVLQCVAIQDCLQYVAESCSTLHCVTVCCNVFFRALLRTAACYRVAETHRMPYVYRSFSGKEHTISGSFAENNLQLKASYGSLPPYTVCCYGVATISRLLQIIGLFCRI